MELAIAAILRKVRRSDLESLSWILVILFVGGLLAWAGSQGGRVFLGVPVFALCGGLAFVVNWIVFAPSFLRQTERFFDLTGSLTYVSVVGTALVTAGHVSGRSILIAGLILTWALRLGSFLFRRISRDGGDGRFDALKTRFLRFLMVWTLQGLWVYLTAACALAAMTSTSNPRLGGFAIVGVVLWLAGFAIEVLADTQKSRFRSDPANRERFIASGLWAWSRHPNYFGEILLWLGIAILAFPALSGWQYATLISPLFVYVLLTRISGIPLLERRAEKRWGGDEAYRAYRDRTPALLLRPPRSSGSAAPR